MPHSRRAWALLGIAATVLVLGAVFAAYLIVKSARTGDILHRNVEFQANATPEPGQPKPGAKFEWPIYGFTKDHNRYFAARLSPPFHKVWTFRGAALLEFPPVLSHHSLYQLAGNGVLNAIGKDSGRVRWRRKLGSLAASTPAASGSSVYVTLLKRFKDSKGGRIVAVRQKDGTTRWSRKLPSRSESSPLLDRGKLYVGSEDGTVYALNAHDGSVIWTFRASGAVKGSPTLADGKLYFGDYGGHVYALRASSGRNLWKSNTGGTVFGSGNFYGTAAVQFGRVYIGNTDGRVYSFAARNGKLAWAKQTGRYVYSSPAVADIPGLGPTVFVGSYDGSFYALSARDGSVRWKHNAGGKISGGATIVGRVVYYSNLGKKRIAGLDVQTGRPVWGTRPGSFDPVVSDGTHLFVTGYTGLRAMLPGPAPAPVHHAHTFPSLMSVLLRQRGVSNPSLAPTGTRAMAKLGRALARHRSYRRLQARIALVHRCHALQRDHHHNHKLHGRHRLLHLHCVLHHHYGLHRHKRRHKFR